MESQACLRKVLPTVPSLPVGPRVMMLYMGIASVFVFYFAFTLSTIFQIISPIGLGTRMENASSQDQAAVVHY